MYSSHLESGIILTTGKHTQMTKENNEGMKDLSTSSVSHVSRKPLQCIHITTLYAGHIVEVTSETTTMMICSLIENGFPPVFLIVGKVMLYSNAI